MNQFDGDPFSSLGSLPRGAAAQLARPSSTLRPGEQIRVTLPYPPSANRYWRSRVITPKSGPAIVSTYVSAEAKAFKERAGWLLKAAGVRKPLAGRVHVHIELWPHRPQDWARRAKADPLYWADTVQRLDLDNCRKVVTDALKGVVIDDDRQVWKDSGEVMEPDGREACLVVTITPLVKESPQEVLC